MKPMECVCLVSEYVNPDDPNTWGWFMYMDSDECTINSDKGIHWTKEEAIQNAKLWAGRLGLTIVIIYEDGKVTQ